MIPFLISSTLCSDWVYLRLPMYFIFFAPSFCKYFYENLGQCKTLWCIYSTGFRILSIRINRIGFLGAPLGHTLAGRINQATVNLDQLLDHWNRSLNLLGRNLLGLSVFWGILARLCLLRKVSSFVQVLRIRSMKNRQKVYYQKCISFGR